MQQGPLPFQYESQSNRSLVTSLGGLLLYLEAAAVCHLPEAIRAGLNLRPTQGFSDVQQIMALVALNLAGGESVDDLRVLEADTGFTAVLGEIELHGLRKTERKQLDARFRSGTEGTLPSPSSSLRYLEEFHSPEQELLREPGVAFVPEPNEPLAALAGLPAAVVARAQWSRPSMVATLDQDATLVESYKADALHCYKGFKAFQPLNVYWAEHGMVLYSEFRDGNAPAGWRNLAVFQHSLGLLPGDVREVRFRADSAGYEVELLKFCAEGRSRYGVIEFAISADVTKAFRRAVAELDADDWRPYYVEDKQGRVKTDHEWAEVCFVPNWVGHSKGGPEYRFLAVREPISQQDLPGLERDQKDLPFPVEEFDGRRFKLFGVVSNTARDKMNGNELIAWHRQRCGKSKEAHSIMKSDLAGGRLPSEHFGANAAWWQIMLVAFNLNAFMLRHVMPAPWAVRRMKYVRFALINIPAQVIRSGRRTIVRVPAGHPSLAVIRAARGQMLTMATGPPTKWLSAA